MKKIVLLFLLIINFGVINNSIALEIYVTTDSYSAYEPSCAQQRTSSRHTGKGVSKSCRESEKFGESVDTWIISPIKFFFKSLFTIWFAAVFVLAISSSIEQTLDKKSTVWSGLLLLFLLTLATVIVTFEGLFIKYEVYWWIFVIILFGSVFIKSYDEIFEFRYYLNERNKFKASRDKAKARKAAKIVITSTELNLYLKEDLLTLAKYYKVKFGKKDTKHQIQEKIIKEIDNKFLMGEMFSTDKDIVRAFFSNLKSKYKKNRRSQQFIFKEMLIKEESHWSKIKKQKN